MIPIAKPFYDQRELDAAADAIRSGWVSQGPRVATLEREFAAFVGAAHACAVSNCTDALELALLAVGVSLGDAVICPSHSFIATANCVRACGGEPLFAEIEENGMNVDPAAVRQLLTTAVRREDGLYYQDIARLARGQSPLRHLHAKLQTPAERLGRIGAIIAVHQIGIPCDLPALRALSSEFGVPLIEDAACAIGSERSDDGGTTWYRIGQAQGSIACFSFHPRKLLSTGEGGIITTNDSVVDARLRELRHHGMSISDLVRSQSQHVIIEDYAVSGRNSRLTDIQAAIGSVQLAKVPENIAGRQSVAQRYRARLEGVPWVRLLSAEQSHRWNLQSFPLILGAGAPVGRDELLGRLATAGVSCRPGVMNAHTEPCFREQGWKLPKSEKMRERSIMLPMYPQLSDEEIDLICSVITR